MKKNHNDKFKTPEGYFDSFNERLMDKIVQEESVIPKTDGFGVPEGYIENVDKKILAQIDTKETKVISLASYRKYYYAAAAIAAIFVLVFGLNIYDGNKLNPEWDLTNTEIDAYFEENELGLSSYEIAEVMDVEIISITDMTDENLEEEAILNYLDENLDEIEDLNLDYEELQ